MTQVKVCGITNLEDALATAEAGADLLGFVFYPPSPRAVGRVDVRPIAERIRRDRPDVGLVGVFVDEPVALVAATANSCALTHVQLHGDETPEEVDALVAQGFGVIKAFRVRDTDVVARMRRYAPTAYLLDTFAPGRPGGTGEAFDWRLARSAPSGTRIVIAGGLTPENVAEAVRTAQPWGVDVSSGVEAKPGHKDRDKVRRFVAVARGAIKAVGPE